jgi:DHA2 family multidrug resistance protein-like MFS transporter
MSMNAALVRYIYPAKILGRGIALNGLVVALGVALGPSVAAAVLAVASWPYLFLINLPLGGLAFAFALTSLPKTPLSGGRFDYLSSILLALGLGGLVVGLDGVAHHSSLLLTLALVAIGAVSMVLLVRRQLGRSAPLLPVDLLARSGFRIAFLTGFCGFVASNFFIISMPFAIMDVMHRTAVQTGLIMTPWAACVGLVAPFVGRLTDRYPASVLSTLGLAITATSFLLLRLLPPNPADLAIAWRIGLAGAGFGLFQPPNNKAMLTTAPASRTGSASGMISVARLSGQTVGAMLVALTLGLLPQGGTEACLALDSATAFLGAGLSATRIRLSKRAKGGGAL